MKPISEGDLITWLKQELPAFFPYLTAAIAKEFDEDDEDIDEPLSAYFVFFYGVKPYIEQALEQGDTTQLTAIFARLEYLATAGDAAVQNELGVGIMEAMQVSRHRFWPFLGPILRQREFVSITWFPIRVDQATRDNTHVDPTTYHQRWQEEIVKLGGFERLTIEQELRIRYQLVQEFQIVGLRAIEPGSAEWLRYGLLWPIPGDD